MVVAVERQLFQVGFMRSGLSNSDILPDRNRGRATAPSGGITELVFTKGGRLRAGLVSSSQQGKLSTLGQLGDFSCKVELSGPMAKTLSFDRVSTKRNKVLQRGNRGLIFIGVRRESRFTGSDRRKFKRRSWTVQLFLIKEEVGRSFQRNLKVFEDSVSGVWPDVMVINEIEEAVHGIKPRADEVPMVRRIADMVHGSPKEPGLFANTENWRHIGGGEILAHTRVGAIYLNGQNVGRLIDSLSTVAISPPQLEQLSSISPWQEKAASRESERSLAAAEML
jgi:hypothetical protein